jgi:hypothetical protein
MCEACQSRVANLAKAFEGLLEALNALLKVIEGFLKAF